MKLKKFACCGTLGCGSIILVPTSLLLALYLFDGDDGQVAADRKAQEEWAWLPVTAFRATTLTSPEQFHYAEYLKTDLRNAVPQLSPWLEVTCQVSNSASKIGYFARADGDDAVVVELHPELRSSGPPSTKISSTARELSSVPFSVFTANLSGGLIAIGHASAVQDLLDVDLKRQPSAWSRKDLRPILKEFAQWEGASVVLWPDGEEGELIEDPVVDFAAERAGGAVYDTLGAFAGLGVAQYYDEERTGCYNRFGLRFKTRRSAVNMYAFTRLLRYAEQYNNRRIPGEWGFPVHEEHTLQGRTILIRDRAAIEYCYATFAALRKEKPTREPVQLGAALERRARLHGDFEKREKAKEWRSQWKYCE